MGLLSKIQEKWDDLRSEVRFQMDGIKEELGIKTSETYPDYYIPALERSLARLKGEHPKEDKKEWGNVIVDPKNNEELQNADWLITLDDDDLESPMPEEANQQLVQQEADLYLQKQQDFQEMLTQYLVWQEEKERQELWLEGERERFAYDLQCRRIEMEKECRLYELQLQHDDLSYQQRGQIEQLKTEIERLKLELERRLY